MGKWLLVAAVIVGLIAGSFFVVYADKTTTTTWKTVVLRHVQTIQLTWTGDGWQMQATAVLRDAGGNPTGPTVTLTKKLGVGASTAIETFITNNVLDGLNAQEGL